MCNSSLWMEEQNGPVEAIPNLCLFPWCNDHLCCRGCSASSEKSGRKLGMWGGQEFQMLLLCDGFCAVTWGQVWKLPCTPLGSCKARRAFRHTWTQNPELNTISVTAFRKQVTNINNSKALMAVKGGKILLILKQTSKQRKKGKKKKKLEAEF